MTEIQTRLEKPEDVRTVQELSQAIELLMQQVYDPAVAMGVNEDGYGKCVEAMWRAGYMAMEMVARELGVTGFQHSMASLCIYGELQNIKGPYMALRLEDNLYSGDRIQEKVDDWLAKDTSKKFLKDEAQKLIDKHAGDSFPVHPDVWARWQELANGPS